MELKELAIDPSSRNASPRQAPHELFNRDTYADLKRLFLLTADLRRRTQTFLPRDLRGKKHVNRCAINSTNIE
jgi:hypothetical protein